MSQTPVYDQNKNEKCEINTINELNETNMRNDEINVKSKSNQVKDTINN